MNEYFQIVGKDKLHHKEFGNERDPALVHRHHQDTENQSGSCFLLVSTWWNEAAWPGMGLFGESYILFSIGLIKPFWEILYPECFNFEVCTPQLLDSLTYSVVLGVICGMLVLGYSANRIGRRIGAIMTASFMTAGAIGLTAISFLSVNNPNALFHSMTVLLFVFGFGVGGEYPMSSSTATEKAMGEMKEKLRVELEKDARRSETSASSIGLDALGHPTFHLDVVGHCDDGNLHSKGHMRGRAVQLVFLSQGIGIIFNSLCLVILLLLFGQYGANIEGGNYAPEALLAIWRIVYFIGALILIFVLFSRVAYLEESSVWTDDKERREKLDRTRAPTPVSLESTCGYVQALDQPVTLTPVLSTVSSLSTPSTVMADSSSSATEGFKTISHDDIAATPVWLLLRYYGWRIFGSSMVWLLWDVSFYGNKLFQSKFLFALAGENTTLLELSAAATLNAFVALLGYIGAALLLDNPHAGRLRLQQYGLLTVGILFVGCGCLYNKLASVWLVVMYFASSFIGQLGPNATTFLVPSEIFPTEMRTLCHGVAAASGKIGALLAAMAFNHVGDVDMFLMSGYASIGACIITFWTIPDVTSLDLYEVDRQWRMTLEGRRAEYVGDAKKPEFLSYYERSKLGLNY